MSFDPELFGQAMGEAIRKAVEPLNAEIADLRKQIDESRAQLPDIRQLVADEVAKIPTPENGKDADESAIVERVTQAIKGDLDQWKADAQEQIVAPELPNISEMVDLAVSEAVKMIPAPKDGASFTLEDAQPIIDKAVRQIPVPKDGIGMAGSMIDRDGNLIITMTNGETKNLGPVVGKDGVSLESFEMTYDADAHEVVLKAISVGKPQEIRYPAGGIHGKGYWRDGNKAKSGEAWTHDGSLWVAKNDTSETPSTKSGDWVLAARRGRDGESVVRRVKDGPAAPIKLGGDDAGND